MLNRLLPLGVLLIGTAVTAQQSVPQQSTRDQCICMSVCASKISGRMQTNVGQGCPPIADELIYDNMARCNCQALSVAPKPPVQSKQKTSPNH